MNQEKLSKNWQIKTLEELCDEIFAGGDVPKNNFSKIKTEDFNIPIYANGEKNLGLYGYTNISKVNSPALTISGRGTIGFSVVRKVPFFPIVRLLVLIPNSETDVQFLKYSIDNCNIKHTGSSIPQLTVPTVKVIKIPIPNLETQQAIVSKIEELFSELDKGIEDLKIAQQQLKTYRQSVLKWAFEGKLTNENVKDGELPKGWKILKIKDVSKVINGDRSKNYPSRSHYVNEGIPFISAGTIDENKINKTDINYITESKFNSLRSGKLEKRDLIYCLRGSLGKCAIYPFSKGAISSSLCIVRASELIELEYLFYYLLSPLANIEILKYDNGTAQPNLSAKDFSNFEIPFASKDEQYLIIQEIESRLSVADKMEESIAQSLQQAEALRQSILKKAFSGELV